jgi:protein-disulfide isomerase
MKYIATAAAISALVALSGCNSAGDNTSAAAAPSAPVTAVAAPAGADWATTFSETADGGYLKGNPNAAVKLIEYGALSCPHCAHFMHESHDELEAMIKTGKVSYELRPFLIHPQIDLPATLLAECNGAATFFPLAEQMFARQEDWFGAEKFKALTPEVQKAWTTMTPSQLAADVADRLGLVTFVEQRGVSADKAKACLANKAGIDKIMTMMNTADAKYHVSSTPTFILNGALVPDVNDWDKLKPRIKAALGG